MRRGWRITVRGIFSASDPFLRLWRFKKTDLDGTWFVIVDQPVMANCIIDVAKSRSLHGICSPVALEDKPPPVKARPTSRSVLKPGPQPRSTYTSGLSAAPKNRSNSRRRGRGRRGM